MLKSMRNNLMTKNIVFEGKTVRWSDIHRLYELDGDSGAFRATKLTIAHVNPTNRQKMKVKLAAQVFSRSTASLLHILSKTGVMDAAGIAIFVKFMDDLFDSMNSVVTSSTKPLACQLTRTSQHLAFWDSARRKLNRIKFYSGGKCVGNPPTIKLLLATIGNVRYLWDSLKEMGFEHLSLRSLNQDPLENLFSVARGLCGGNTKPSASQFVDAYKTVILSNTARCDIGTNCEDDGGDFLVSYQILLGNDPGNTTSSDPSDNPSTTSAPSPYDSTTKLSSNIKSTVLLSEVDLNKSACVAEYLIKKLLNYECECCDQFFRSDGISDVHNLIVFSDNDTDGNLNMKYPSATFVNIIAVAKERIFVNIPNIIRHPNILSHLSYSDFPQSFCTKHGTEISKRLSTHLTLLLLNHFIKLCNNKLHKTDLTPNNVVDSFLKDAA
nr:uncharacterized protein LOC111417223 [Onthophagus taurus]